MILNKEQILDLYKNLVNIGSHMVNYLRLTQISEKLQIDELKESQKILRKTTKEGNKFIMFYKEISIII